MTWLFLVGFVVAVGSAAVLSITMNARDGRHRSTHDSIEAAR